MREGIIPLEIRKGKAQGQGGLDLQSLFKSRIPLEVLVIFCRQLYSLTKAGVPLLRAIKGLSQSSAHPLMKESLDAVSDELTNGRPLSVAMKQHPRVFSELYVSMIHVGENTGRLDESLLQLANYFEQEMETRRRIKSAMRYPTFVISAIMLAMVVLNVKVIPQFTSMFSRFGGRLTVADPDFDRQFQLFRQLLAIVARGGVNSKLDRDPNVATNTGRS